MWYPIERKQIFTGEPLVAGAVRTFTNIFPLDGCGWYKMRLTFHAALAAIVAPYADGMYRWIKGIKLSTSRGETLVNNVSGMALYRLNCYLNHSAPYHTPLLAAGVAEVTANLDIPFEFPFLSRKEDTILATGRYSNLELQITTGTLADLSVAGAVGFTVPTVCCEIISTMSALKSADGMPLGLPFIETYPTVHVDVRPFWDITSAEDLALFGFFIYNHDAIAAGRPFCCVAAGLDHLYDITFRDNLRSWLSLLTTFSFQQERQLMLPYNHYAAVAATEIPTLEAGMYPHLFVKNGSYKEAYATGGKNIIRLEFADLTATDEADLCVFGVRALRN